MSGNQGKIHSHFDNSFYLPVHTAPHVNAVDTNTISQIMASWVPPSVPGSYAEGAQSCYGASFTGSSMPEFEASHISGVNDDISHEMVSDHIAKIGATVFDGSAVPRDQQRTGKQLLAQLERDLKEFDLLMGCPSPPEVDTDSLEETLRSLALLSSQDTLLTDTKSFQNKANDDSDSDTVKSEVSNFSCDSLEDEEDQSAEQEPEETPRHRVFEAPKTLPLPRRKRQRWQRLSLGGITKDRPNDYGSDIFPTNEISHNHHSQVFRTASDTALANSDSSHSDVQTPTNPPYFSVKSPVSKVAPQPLPTASDSRLHQVKDTPHSSQASNTGNNTVTTLTVETHSYHYERESPVPYPLPRSPVIDQLRREAAGETSPRRQPQRSRATLPPANYVEADDFPVVQAQPLPPGPPPAVYLPCSQPAVGPGVIPAPGRAHRVLLAKKVTIQQVLPSKRKRDGSLFRLATPYRHEE